MQIINNIYKERFYNKNRKCRYNYILAKYDYYKPYKYFIKFLLDKINFEVYKKENGDDIAYISFNKNGKFHRDDESPAIISKYLIEYYKNGLPHREGDLPAIIDTIFHKLEYYKNGRLHRDGDNPAIIYLKKLNRSYYKEGKLHRDDNAKGKPQPALIKANGHKFYYKNDREFFYNKKTGEINNYW